MAFSSTLRIENLALDKIHKYGSKSSDLSKSMIRGMIMRIPRGIARSRALGYGRRRGHGQGHGHG